MIDESRDTTNRYFEINGDLYTQEGYMILTRDTISRFYKINDVVYTEDGYFGCQLRSFEFKRPPVSWNSRRVFFGYEIEPVNSIFHWSKMKWEISWCLTNLHKTNVSLDDQHRIIREFKEDLRTGNKDMR